MPIATLYAARNIGFAPTLEFEYEGAPLPLGGATISMQVREYPGAAGAPLAADPAVEFTDETHPTQEGWRRLTIFPALSQESLAAMPGQNQPTPGDAQTFVQEIKISYADGMQDSLLSGEFILSAGVNFA
ncbi:hypothetical protein LH128_05880 [Sphingomonas sp. LH128]|uniref:hypothetical protein n=1 Tax=Sphingomonas sp. LH128 TaxID=473781 RepID=UPI00027CA6E7|nr:hypothetical protein [Sphingomonas sp. LH128]EJU14004.1 hypothetical protein LH128_05880 [Sphingomonas sp. LH128]